LLKSPGTTGGAGLTVANVIGLKITAAPVVAVDEAINNATTCFAGSGGEEVSSLWPAPDAAIAPAITKLTTWNFFGSSTRISFRGRNLITVIRVRGYLAILPQVNHDGVNP
jgi:hypothetical protein